VQDDRVGGVLDRATAGASEPEREVDVLTGAQVLRPAADERAASRRTAMFIDGENGNFGLCTARSLSMSPDAAT
jgi:hypothetical protein